MHDDHTIVIVGSGPAGAVATALLTEAGLHVTLLESGPERSARGLTARIGGVTVARVHRPLVPRSDGVTATGDPGAVLFEDLAPGGLTNHWSCAVPRFSRDDFADARRAGEAFTWPVDYDDLVPWYEWVEPRLAISGTPTDIPPLAAGRITRATALGPTWKAIAAIAEQRGQGIVPIPYTYGATTTLTWSGTVFNSFTRMVAPALRSGRLDIRFDAHATRLEWSGSTRRVTGVVYRDRQTGEDHRVPCRAVVVAAGAVGTAKLLLQSTDSDFPQGLGNTHGVLGRYLHDHPLGKAEIDLEGALDFNPPAYITREPLDRCQPLYAAACLQWGGVRPLVTSLLGGHPGRMRWSGFNVFGTMAPRADDYVALDPSHSSKDGTPGLLLNVRHPRESAATLEATRDRLIDLLQTGGLKPRLRKWLIEPVGMSVHYAGTCRMHASPAYGMLDPWSRLHAVPNVVVADSAAFTTGPEKNPVLTAMALAARASDRLANDLRTNAI